MCSDAFLNCAWYASRAAPMGSSAELVVRAG